MKLQPAPVAWVPRTLAKHAEVLQQTTTPGLIIGIGDVVAQHEPARAALRQFVPNLASGSSPYLMLSPEQTLSFTDPDVQKVLKYAAKETAKLVHPEYGPLVVQGCWFVYKAHELYKARQSGMDAKKCLLKVAGLAVDGAGAIGDAFPALQMPDHWKNGVNLLIRTSDAWYEGKIPDAMEVAGWHDSKIALMNSVQRIAVTAFKPNAAQITVLK